MANTIAEFIIRDWLEQRFQPGALKVQMEGDTARVQDRNGEEAVVVYDRITKQVYMEGCDHD